MNMPFRRVIKNLLLLIDQFAISTAKNEEREREQKFLQNAPTKERKRAISDTRSWSERHKHRIAMVLVSFVEEKRKGLLG